MGYYNFIPVRCTGLKTIPVRGTGLQNHPIAVRGASQPSPRSAGGFKTNAPGAMGLLIAFGGEGEGLSLSVDDEVVAVGDLAAEDFFGKGVVDFLLDEPL